MESHEVYIPLVSGGITVIDATDEPLVNQHQWRKSGDYVATGNQPVIIYLHRFILGITDTRTLVDHRNRNGLDNRRKNLRVATPSQNAANKVKQRGAYSSQYKGVTRRSDNGKWRAFIECRGVRKTLGCFATEEQAARAYDAAAIELFGEFARLNFDVQSVA